MRSVSDKAVARLRNLTELPDLSGTHYRLIGQVARGGMGIVYAAEDVTLQRRVALKVLDASASQGELASRLMREARVLAQLEHPGIVPVHDVGTLPDGRVFYTMKLVKGRRLDEYIETVASATDRLRIFLRICDPVAFAHAHGVLHRDLKPSNVMIGPFGEVLVMDWGLAKILGETAAGHTDPAENAAAASPSTAFDVKSAVTAAVSASTVHGSVMGTPGYMSPEQASGAINSLDARSDVFSLGALLRYLLTERLAGTSTIRKERPLQAICAKACAPEAEARYASVIDLSADVSRYLDGAPVGAHRETIFERLARFYRRHRFFILVIAAYLVMRVIFVLAVPH